MPQNTVPSLAVLNARHAIVKRAASSDQGNDVPFEQLFSNLAHAYLGDRAPGLLDYEIGFQLVDRNDDDSKAVGVTGFKIGPEWLYAPVFFIGGSLKGHELLYIKGDKQFVPLEEGWIDYLTGRKPASLGHAIPKNDRRFQRGQPDLYQALRSPSKYASVVDADLAKEASDAVAKVHAKDPALAAVMRTWPDWAKVAAATMATAIFNDATPRHDGSRLLDLVATGGIKVAKALGGILEAYPLIRRGFSAFYTPEAVKTALDRASTVVARPVVKQAKPARWKSLVDPYHPNRGGRLAITQHGVDVIKAASTLLWSESERRDQTTLPLFIKDARRYDEVSHAYVVPVLIDSTVQFMNPDRTGIYNVMFRNGETKKCFIAVSPRATSTNTSSMAIVVTQEGDKKRSAIIDTSQVFAEQCDDPWMDWFKELPEIGSLDNSDTVILIGPKRQTTLPLCIDRRLDTDTFRGGATYEVSCREYRQLPRPVRPGLLNSSDEGDTWLHSERLTVGEPAGSRIRIRGNELYVPSDFRKLVVPDNSNIELGDGRTLESMLYAKTAAVHVRDRGAFIHINDVSFLPNDAVVHLVRDHGLREESAREVLKIAETARRETNSAAEFRFKYADPYNGDPYLINDGSVAPAFHDQLDYQSGHMGTRVPETEPQEYEERVPALAADYSNRDVYAYNPDEDASGTDTQQHQPDSDALGVAGDAAQRGQREVFETSMFASMLKSTRDDQLVEDHIDPMMKSLNELGEMLCTFYWNGERYAERYGDQEMPELEDTLTNAFDVTGRLILFLKRHAPDGAVGRDLHRVELDDVAGD